MNLSRPLPGFIRIEDRNGLFLVREEYKAPLEGLGLFGPAGPWVRHDGGGKGNLRAGRGRPRVLPLDGREGEHVVVRVYHHGGALRWLFRTLFLDRNRSFRELALLERIAQLGVPTLKVVGALAWKVLPGLYRHALVTVQERGARDLLTFLLEEERPRERRKVLEEAGRVVRRLHDFHVAHADLHPGNILVTREGARRVLIIDLDQSEIRPALDRAARVRGLARLERFLRKLSEREGLELGRMERMRFLKGYYGRFGPQAREELALVERRLARHLPWHRGVWAVEAFLTGKAGKGRPTNPDGS